MNKSPYRSNQTNQYNQYNKGNQFQQGSQINQGSQITGYNQTDYGNIGSNQYSKAEFGGFKVTNHRGNI